MPPAPAQPRRSGPASPIGGQATAGQAGAGGRPPARAERPGLSAEERIQRREAENGSSRWRALIAVAGLIIVIVLAVILLTKGGGSSGKGTSSVTVTTAAGTTTTSSTSKLSSKKKAKPAVKAAPPAETTVSVLNGTETTGLAHRIAASLQQGGYSQATPLTGRPPGANEVTVVEYATGHKPEAEGVAQALGVTHVQAEEQAVSVLAGSASVVVIVGADKAKA